jgi:hypothetical protein
MRRACYGVYATMNPGPVTMQVPLKRNEASAPASSAAIVTSVTIETCQHPHHFSP